MLAVDSRGRVRMSRERRERLLDEFERSGLSGGQFCKVVGVKYQTFASWRQQRECLRQTRAAEAARKEPALEWLEAVMDQAGVPVGKALVVRLPSGAALEVEGPDQVSMAVTLLRAWEKSLC